ncbi:MAG: autotransporter domain-containing protein [Rhizobacter sp.]
MSPSRWSRVIRAASLALLCGSCLCAHAQTAKKPAPFRGPPAPAIDCPPPQREDCLAAQKRQEEPDRAERPNEQAAPQLAGDAPLPPQGAGEPPVRFEREPLRVRGFDTSIGIDHALSRQWSLGGLLGVSRGKLQRHQAEFATDSVIPNDPGTESDTTVRTTSTTLGATLSYFPQPSVFIDGTLSLRQTRFEMTRVVNGLAEFNGDNRGRSLGLSFAAGKVWRMGPRVVVPQVGLDYVDSRTDALQTTYHVYDSPGMSEEGFSVSEQRQKSLAALVSAQVQWPLSTSAGTLTPYVRGTWRERLWLKADTVTASAPGAHDRHLDPEDASIKRSFGLAGGMVALFQRGISVFTELSLARGSELRETRLGLGIKFER